jgi:outer membrane protein assembly factor BamB
MNQSEDSPAGALLCVAAETGVELWRFPVGDGVLAKPLADGNFVYFGSRDGNLYCLHRDQGKLAWKHSLGSPIVAAPVVARCNFCGARTNVHTVTSDGQLVCLGANEGRIAWSLDLVSIAHAPMDVYSSPALRITPDGRQIYVGAQVNAAASIAVLYCIEDHVDREAVQESAH